MKRTLLVLGAGASCAVHPRFPVGIELVQLIDTHLTTTLYSPIKLGEGPFVSTLVNVIMKEWEFDIDSTITIVEAIKRKLWSYIQAWYYESFHCQVGGISIDELVNNEFSSAKDERISKIVRFAIAYLIKGAEHGLVRAYKSQFISEISWIGDLIGRHEQAITGGDISILTFNYDRVIEYELSRCLKHNRRFPVEVHHVYGQIGNLQQVPFERNNDEATSELRRYSENIKLIHEREVIPVAWRLNNFDRVLFAGFGFNLKNLSVLGMNERIHQECFGMTIYKESLPSGQAELSKLGIQLCYSTGIQDFFREKLQ